MGTAHSAVFQKACELIYFLKLLADAARVVRERELRDDCWLHLAGQFGWCFVLRDELLAMMTPRFVSTVRGAHPANADPIRIGSRGPSPSVIEFVAQQVSIDLRRALYDDEERSPLDPDPCEVLCKWAEVRADSARTSTALASDGAVFFELQSDLRHRHLEKTGLLLSGDRFVRMALAWRLQDRSSLSAAVGRMCLDDVNFDDLAARLLREAAACDRAAASQQTTETQAAALLAQLTELRKDFESLAMARGSGSEEISAQTRPSGVLKSWGMKAWMLGQIGMKQSQIAAQLSKELEDPSITQPRVSEQIRLAKSESEKSGLAELAARKLPSSSGKPRAPGRTFDPRAADATRSREPDED
ncbi:MAG: hypothetical protein U0572_09820 [Phycisphaerales bacterium]